MATGQRREIDRDRRGDVTTECPAPHFDGSGLLGDVSRSAACKGNWEHQAVSCSRHDVIGHWCRSEGGHIFGSRPVACAGQPPSFQGVIGLFKTEEIYRRGPWKGLEDVEFATLEWVAWYNHRRLLAPLGYVPPAEFEQAYYDRHVAPGAVAVLT